MTGEPSVTCIVLNMNGRDLLVETLRSLSAMPYPNAHIIVVDNGSTDGSQDAVRSGFPRFELIENGSNLGFGGGNNVGMRRAIERKADWVMLLNNDIEVEPAMLSELMRVARSDEKIGVLSPLITYHSEPGVIWYAGGRVNFWTGIISHRGLRERDSGRYRDPEDTGYITGCAFLVRRTVLEEVGLFDDVYHPIYSEDADLSERIRRAGYRLVLVPAAKLRHKVSAFSGGGLTPFKTMLKVEHNFIFLRRYARWYHWLTIPWCVGASACLFVARELMKGNFAIVSALMRGFAAASRRLFIW